MPLRAPPRLPKRAQRATGSVAGSCRHGCGLDPLRSDGGRPSDRDGRPGRRRPSPGLRGLERVGRGLLRGAARPDGQDVELEVPGLQMPVGLDAAAFGIANLRCLGALAGGLAHESAAETGRLAARPEVERRGALVGVDPRRQHLGGGPGMTRRRRNRCRWRRDGGSSVACSVGGGLGHANRRVDVAGTQLVGLGGRAGNRLAAVGGGIAALPLVDVARRSVRPRPVGFVERVSDDVGARDRRERTADRHARRTPTARGDAGSGTNGHATRDIDGDAQRCRRARHAVNRGLAADRRDGPARRVRGIARGDVAVLIDRCALVGRRAGDAEEEQAAVDVRRSFGDLVRQRVVADDLTLVVAADAHRRRCARDRIERPDSVDPRGRADGCSRQRVIRRLLAVAVNRRALGARRAGNRIQGVAGVDHGRTGGVEQHLLIRAEKEILESTLMGSIKVLADFLNVANPEAFGRSVRIARYVRHVSRKFKLEFPWRLDAAATLSQLGCITLDSDVIQRAFVGIELPVEDQARFDAHPETAMRMLSGIPRLEAVAWMIGQQLKRKIPPEVPNLPASGLKETLLGAKILKIAVAFDGLWMKPVSEEEAIRRLRARRDEFESEMVDALEGIVFGGGRMENRRVATRKLATGMVLDQEIRNSQGMLIAAKGQEITRTVLIKLENFFHAGLIDREVAVLAPASE